jgi:hypothetical protein
MAIGNSDINEFLQLFSKGSVSSRDIAAFGSNIVQRYLRSLLIEKSDPEAALAEAFASLFQTLAPQAAAGLGSIDYVVETADQGKLGVELKKCLQYDAQRNVLVPTSLNPYLNTKNSWEIKDQVFRYSRSGNFTYIVLTNLKSWYFYDPTYCTTVRKTKPFFELPLNECYRRFGKGFSIDGIGRLQRESSRIDLGDRFYADLTSWVQQLKKLAFLGDLDSVTKLEDAIFVLNKFIFVRTLEANLVVPEDLIGREWSRLARDYPNRPNIFIRAYFKAIDDFFHYYYDTELFDPARTETLLRHIADNDEAWRSFVQKLSLVLGIGQSGAGIRNYRFEQLDIDVFGGTYERFLAEEKNVRKARGIYYTPGYVTDYIVYQTVVPYFDERIATIETAIESAAPDEALIMSKMQEILEFKICDISCGSGSFLTQAFSYIWEKYLELGNYLKRKADQLRRQVPGQRPLLEEESVHQKIIARLLHEIGYDDKLRLASLVMLRHLFGNDADKRATEVAKLNLWLEAIRLAPDDFKHDSLPSEATFILPDLELNLTVGDSILGLESEEASEEMETRFGSKIRLLNELRGRYLKNLKDESAVKQAVKEINELAPRLTAKFDSRGRTVHPCHFPLFFWPAFFDSEGRKRQNAGFHAIVGNPPYGREQTEAARELMKYRSPNDTYTILIERAIELLRSDGRLSYIVPVTWQTQPDFRDFRAYVVAEKFVQNVVNLPFDTFKDAYVDCGIVTIANRSPQP